jgi:hypothetical protein
MRTILATAAILCAMAVSASGQALITHSVTYIDSYTVSYNSTETEVDVYKLTLNADPGWVIGAIDIVIGRNNDPNRGVTQGQDPFQGWRRLYDVDEETWSDSKTPTQKGTKSFNTRALWTGTNIYQTDSRFICNYDMNDPNNFGDPNKWIDNWLPAPIIGPAENNDMSIYDPDDSYTSTEASLGKGELWVTAGVPFGYRMEQMPVALIGIVQGDRVWCRDMSAATPPEGSSEVIDETFEIIPEPATLALLAVGAGSLLRRKTKMA